MAEQSSRVFVITGGNAGIGKETAREVARAGHRIILASRDVSKCDAVRLELLKETNTTR